MEGVGHRVLKDEASLKSKERGERQQQSKNLKRAILGVFITEAW